VHHEHHAQIDSTNEKAVRVWRQQCEQFSQRQPEPLLISADVQTAGRGRQGRVWRSPMGGLWMSLAWPAPLDADEYQGLPLVAGLAVAEGIQDATGLVVQIKWPNDLLIDDQKVAGILCEYQSLSKPAVIVGIGVNVNLNPEALGQGLRHPPTTLQEQLSRPIRINELRDAVVRRLQNRLRVFERDGLGLILGSIRKRLAWLEMPIGCELPSGERRDGVLEGIDDRGRLLMNHETDGTIALDIGDIVHVSPAKINPAPTGDPLELQNR
jgi:BirA family biotin operon repressor/biotin-[acetyl-CoA-carboxylase] ligase